MLGREVETLVHEMKPAGNYSVTWNPAATLPNGVYFYRLSVVPSAQRDLDPTDGRDEQSSNSTETKKCLFLK